MLQKAVKFDCKVDVDERTFSGWAAVFGNVDLGGDRILQGAFKKTIADRFAGKTPPMVKVLWQHYQPLGMPIELSEDDHGLKFKAQVSRTVLGDEALTLMDDGVISQMSFGYDPIVWEMVEEDGKEIRNLKELKLYEISPVTFPMNEDTAITAVQKMLAGAPISDEAKGLLLMAARLGVKTIGQEGSDDEKNAAELLGSLGERLRSLDADFAKLKALVEEQPGEQPTVPNQPVKSITDDDALIQLLNPLRSLRKSLQPNLH